MYQRFIFLCCGGVISVIGIPSARSEVGRPLFISPLCLTIEYLSRLTYLAVEDSIIKLYVNGGTRILPQLAFMDDIIIFCRASTNSMGLIKSILEKLRILLDYKLTLEKAMSCFQRGSMMGRS